MSGVSVQIGKGSNMNLRWIFSGFWIRWG